MKKSAWLILYFLILVFEARSEGNRFLTIYFFRGEIEYKDKGKDTKWVILKDRSEQIMSSYLLKLHSGSYLIMYADDGSNIILNKPGIFKVDSLVQSLKMNKESLMGSFFKYIISEFKTFHKDEKKYAEEYMKEVGGVSRGAGISMILPANNEIIYGNVVNFLWSKDNRKEYELIVNGDSSEYKALIQLVSPDTSLKIMKKSAIFSENKKYYWTIKSFNDGPNIFYSFSFADKAYSQKVEKEIQEIKNSSTEFEELKYLLIGTCYEKYFMFSETHRIFEEALIEYPESNELHHAYGLFLVRIGQKDLADLHLKKS